ncbi:Clp Protease (nucleomorph) [Lotharella oceanica]|uniref:ATP-dependent Clp protease proteolytic subunit n=1 Tax=Lotharella oceanica TaxID=641309 RepID=A0A060DC16_9EUKA|nr:Clp Protease [Lotharella oceanica]|mmetsp:Transcript_4143/g.7949  ORF Transcript_4143/g.7949 Transcript_4143/m.7949 type:complete len:267 (+) Transcript_4143:613-1413(+)
MKSINIYSKTLKYYNFINLNKSMIKITSKDCFNHKKIYNYNFYSKKIFNRKKISMKRSMIEDNMDLENFILSNNFFFCFGDINEVMVNMIINDFMYSSLNNNFKDYCKILINSPGGDVVAGLALYDVLTLNNYKLNTIGLGVTASMAAFLLACGNRRIAFPNTRIMIHQPLGVIYGTITEIEIQAKELIFHKNNLNYLLSKLTGQSVSKIERDTTRDKFLTPLEAVEYGLIDNVISSNKTMTYKKFSYLKFSKLSMINWDEINNFI